MVLEEVSVAALGAVEEVEGILFLLGLGGGVLLGGGVHVGVGDAGGLAEEVDAGAVPEPYEDGEGSAEDDIAEEGDGRQCGQFSGCSLSRGEGSGAGCSYCGGWNWRLSTYPYSFGTWSAMDILAV